jgi:hypothetical protein
MSFRNPFNKLYTTKKNVPPSAQERTFEREVKKLEHLEEVTKVIQKDIKKFTESQTAKAKAETKIVHDLQSSAVCRDNEKLRELTDSWSVAARRLEMLSDELIATTQKAVAEPTKRLGVVFPSVQQAIKKREQSLQEYLKCREKNDKYTARERTGPNLVKLENSRKALAAAKNEFETQNNLLLQELPRLYESRIDYFQPSLQALISAQIKYYSESQRTYSDLCKQLDTANNVTDDSLNRSIQQKLSEIRALSITTAEDQL